MNPLLPIGGGLALLYLMTRKGRAPSDVLPPEPMPPEPGPAPAPPAPDVPIIPPPGPNPFPADKSTATVMAPSGLWLHGALGTDAASRLELLPFNSWVRILDNGNVQEYGGLQWFLVEAPSHKTGWVDAEWILFGTDKERGMTPEEERAYHERRAEREDPIFQGRPGASRVGTLSWHAGSNAARPARSFPMRPARVLVVSRLRTAPASAQAVATVPAGELVQVIRSLPDAFGNPAWALCRYRDRHALRAPVAVGWLPVVALGSV